ncbi:MAG: DUF89 family protein [Deltaproteobacteria bacterium]|nr:DUF89 family protein [Deltaproteobacteria bacterium]
MKTYIECIACLVKQAVEISKLHIPKDSQDPFIRDVLVRISSMDYSKPPPVMAAEMYSMIKGLTGITDPYEEIKRYYNEKALTLYPELERLVADSEDPFETALRIAVAGNIIDFGIGTKDSIQIRATIETALKDRFAIDRIHELRQRLTDARLVLYLADNAGEIVFDRLFIEQIGAGRVVCAVRHAPIINDATLDDAEDAGLINVCRVISSGCTAPGTLLPLCSQEFKDIFESADVVVSKGQGNFETLNQSDRDIFFLFMTKCPVISREVGVPVGSFVSLHHDPGL